MTTGFVAVVSPDQPANPKPALGVAVSCTAAPFTLNSPARFTFGVADTVPPGPALAMILKSGLRVAVIAPPDALAVTSWVRAPPSDQDANRHRVRASTETCVSGTLRECVDASSNTSRKTLKLAPS